VEKFVPFVFMVTSKYKQYEAPANYTTATKDQIHQGQFGLDIKAQALPLYEKVFDIEFPLPKLDTLVVSYLGDRLLRVLDQNGQGSRLRHRVSLSPC
jgi:hypothetical protein